MFKNTFTKLKYICVALIFIAGYYFSGCGSGQYGITRGDYKDTAKYKSTGAKLKNYYKIQIPPPFTLQISGGFNLGMSELSSNYQSVFDSADFASGKNFGVKNGFGFMAIGKIPLHKKGNVRLNISANFNHFESDFLAEESPYGDVFYNVIALGVGVENSFSPSLRFKPYIAGEIQADVIYGKANMISSGSTRVVTFENTFRIGYMIYGGAEYMFNNKIGINAGLKLTNANLVLKSSPSSSDPNSVKLRDKRVDGSFPLEFGGYKNFIYTTFYVGMNFYFGVKDIVYQFNK